MSGQINVEHRQFLTQGNTRQKKQQSSLVIQPEWYWAVGEGNAGLTFVPFFRYDEMDSERTHGDIRELQFLDTWSDYEFKAGISKVFWGVTESAHLVDVINQTDSIEALDGEDKLGQPMLHFTAVKEWGITELFYLPYFRERTFSGVNGRLKPSYHVNTDDPEYESKEGKKHRDFSIRYSHFIGDWDIGLSYFQGTNRDPYFFVRDNELVPYYAQMKHTGLDLQGFVGDWLWKSEVIYRDSKENYMAAILGFEYTWVGVFGTVADLGFISEYLYDSRGESYYAIGQNDIFAGFRVDFNEEDSSELLIGMTQDLDNRDVQILKLEASTRLNNHFRLRVEAWGFENTTVEDPLYSFKNDDFVELALEYYF